MNRTSESTMQVQDIAYIKRQCKGIFGQSAADRTGANLSNRSVSPSEPESTRITELNYIKNNNTLPLAKHLN